MKYRKAHGRFARVVAVLAAALPVLAGRAVRAQEKVTLQIRPPLVRRQHRVPQPLSRRGNHFRRRRAGAWRSS